MNGGPTTACAVDECHPRPAIASSSAPPSAVVVEHLGSVEPGGGGALDQHVRPLRDHPDRPGARPARRAGRRQGQVALRVGWDRVQLDSERRRRQRCDPVRLGSREVVGAVQAATEAEQAFTERDPRRSRPGRSARSTAVRRADARSGPAAAPVPAAPASEVAQHGRLGRRARRNAAGEQRAGGKSGLGESDRRRQQFGRAAAAEAGVQCDPAIDASRHGDGCGCRGGTASRCARQRRSPSASAPDPARPLALSAAYALRRVDECEQVAAHPALVGSNDRHHGVGGDRRVDGVATAGEDRDAGVGRQLVGSGDRPVDAADGGRGGCCHASAQLRQVHTIAACRSPRRAGAIVVTCGAVVTLARHVPDLGSVGRHRPLQLRLFELVDRLGFSARRAGGLARCGCGRCVPLLLVLAVVALVASVVIRPWTRQSNRPHRSWPRSMPAVSPSPWSTHRTSPCSRLAPGRSVTSIGAGVMLAGLVVDRCSRLSPTDRVAQCRPSSTSFSTWRPIGHDAVDAEVEQARISSASSIVHTWTW